MEDELERLIREQAQDMRTMRVRQEPFIALSIDAFSEAVEPAALNALVRPPECSLHGYGSVKIQPSGWWHCKKCHREYAETRRRRLGVKPRNFCPHDGQFTQVTPKGKAYCGECARERARKRRRGGVTC